ncbi:MAG TPA: response regulator [Albitalea sp.]
MLRILVIEDSPVDMAMNVAVLERAGHVVLQADRALPGIELARSERPNLILMDLQLPDLDGRLATRMLKADLRTAHIPLVALTAFAMKGDAEESRRAGFDGYLTKPIRYNELTAELRKVMRRRTDMA